MRYAEETKKAELKEVIAEKEQPQDVILKDEELISASGGSIRCMVQIR